MVRVRFRVRVLPKAVCAHSSARTEAQLGSVCRRYHSSDASVHECGIALLCGSGCTVGVAWAIALTACSALRRSAFRRCRSSPLMAVAAWIIVEIELLLGALNCPA